MNKKVYGYARVSTKEQNADRQLIALKHAGISPENIYIDKMSGRNFERPEYKQLLSKLDSDSVLYVKSIDRLGRNYQDLVEQWQIITKDKKADLVVIDMPILDTRRDNNLISTLINDLVLTLLSYVAESEYTFIHQRQAEGIAAAKLRGVRFGRKPDPLPPNFSRAKNLWQQKKITLKEAAKLCDMPISTFFYKAKRT